MVEYDAGRLGRFSLRVADIETLDPKRVDVVGINAQGIDQCARSGLLGALLREQASQ